MAVEQLKPLKEEVHRQLYPNKIGASSTIFTQSSGFLAVQNSFERKKNKKGGEQKEKKKKEEKLTLARVGNGTPYPVII